MKITINSRRKISGIQEEFETLFPYLKLEFFSKPSNQGSASSKRTFVNSSKTLEECRTLHNKGTVTITPGMTVADLLQVFRDVYGLEVQVFRDSGRTWLETSFTDGWTLEEQNRQGASLSKKPSKTA